MLSSRPDRHQAAMVEIFTFNCLAASWTEHRPSPREPPGLADGPSGQPLEIEYAYLIHWILARVKPPLLPDRNPS